MNCLTEYIWYSFGPALYYYCLDQIISLLSLNGGCLERMFSLKLFKSEAFLKISLSICMENITIYNIKQQYYIYLAFLC